MRIKLHPYETAMVYGSRKVIKDANNPDQNHYYDEDIWSLYGKKLDGLIPKGYVVYGELIGWTPSGSPIQEHYTYNVPKGQAHFYVYRVAHVNDNGFIADLSWDVLREFCASAGLNAVPELWRGTVREFDGEAPGFLDCKFAETASQFYTGRMIPSWMVFGTPQNAIALSDDSPCDEGVCIRIEGMIPNIIKHKSPMFLMHETAQLDKPDAVDIESDVQERRE